MLFYNRKKVKRLAKTRTKSLGQKKEVLATVSNVTGRGKKRYAVTYPRDEGLIPEGETITFSLGNWTGDREPQRGQIVILGDITEFEGGWRAQTAEPNDLL